MIRDILIHGVVPIAMIPVGIFTSLFTVGMIVEGIKALL